MDNLIKLINLSLRNNKSKVIIDILNTKKLLTDNKYNEKYYKLYRNYKFLLEKYFLKVLNITSYEQEMINSNLLFNPLKQEEKDIYQLNCLMNTKYIYLRNELSVEKLSNDEIDKIVNLTDEELNSFTSELYDLIGRTFKMVIDKNFDDSVVLMTSYAPESDNYWFDSKELVFGLRYSEFNNGLPDDEWLNNYLQQKKFLKDLIERMETEFTQKLGVKVNFIVYNQYNVDMISD